MSVTFKGVVSKIVNAAKAFKADVLKVAAEAPAIAADVAKDAPEVETLVNAVFPGAAAIEACALSTFELVVQAVEDSGAAANQSGLSVSLDQTVVADIKNLLPSIKAFLAKA